MVCPWLHRSDSQLTLRFCEGTNRGLSNLDRDLGYVNRAYNVFLMFFVSMKEPAIRQVSLREEPLQNRF